MPAQRAAGRRGDAAAGGGKGRHRRRRRALPGKRILGQRAEAGSGEALAGGDSFKPLARRDFGGDGLGGGFGRGDKLGDPAGFLRRILGLAGGIARRNLGLGRRGDLLEHGLAEGGIAHHAPLGQDEALAVLGIEGLQFGLGRRGLSARRLRGQQADRAAALFAQQRCIAQRHIAREHRAIAGRD